MKGILLSILISFLMLASCSDTSNPTEPTEPKKMIIGTWLLEKVLVNYPTGAEEKDPNFFKAHCYIVIGEDNRYYDYYKFGKWVFELEGSYEMVSNNKCKMIAEDRRNPNIKETYYMDINLLTNKNLHILGIAYQTIDNVEYKYPAILKYVKASK